MEDNNSGYESRHPVVIKSDSSAAVERERLLVVDDDPTQLALLATSLEGSYEVSVCKDSEFARAHIAQFGAPDLILLDIMMPGQSGYELCAQLQRDPTTEHVPIIFVTGLADPVSEVTGFNLGASDYVHKPLNLNLLKARISAILRRKRTVNQLQGYIRDVTVNLESHPMYSVTLSNEHPINSENSEELAGLIDQVNSNTRFGIVLADRNGIAVWVNDALSNITGFEKSELVGHFHVAGILFSDTQFNARIWNSLQNSGSWAGELTGRRASGERYPQMRIVSQLSSGTGVVNGYACVVTDISAVKELDLVSDTLIWHDPGTGLPNRLLVRERVKELLRVCAGEQAFTSAIHLDLDRFRRVSDARGYDASMRVLFDFVARVQAVLSPGDTLASLGRDELLILQGNHRGTQEAAVAGAIGLIERIEVCMRKPFYVEEVGDLAFSATFGVVVLPGTFSSAEDVLRAADIAHHEAKSSELNVVFYESDADRSARDTLKAQLELTTAVHDGNLQCFAQPQFNRSREIVGYETLVRWKHSQRGYLPPAQFVQLAEQIGLIVEIDRWMLGEACKFLNALDSTGHMQRVSVNVSANYFESPSFVSDVRSSLQIHGADPNRLVIEVTERVIISDVARVIDIIQSLSDDGVQFSIDDFGTGYSSLQYLRVLPVQELKIDQSFVRKAVEDERDAEIVALIVGLGASLNLRVVAEGIESEFQRRFMLEHFPAIEHQGYLYAEPAPVDRIVESLSR